MAHEQGPITEDLISLSDHHEPDGFAALSAEEKRRLVPYGLLAATALATAAAGFFAAANSGSSSSESAGSAAPAESVPAAAANEKLADTASLEEEVCPGKDPIVGEALKHWVVGDPFKLAVASELLKDRPANGVDAEPVLGGVVPAVAEMKEDSTEATRRLEGLCEDIDYVEPTSGFDVSGHSVRELTTEADRHGIKSVTLVPVAEGVALSGIILGAGENAAAGPADLPFNERYPRTIFITDQGKVMTMGETIPAGIVSTVEVVEEVPPAPVKPEAEAPVEPETAEPEPEPEPEVEVEVPTRTEPEAEQPAPALPTPPEPQHEAPPAAEPEPADAGPPPAAPAPPEVPEPVVEQPPTDSHGAQTPIDPEAPLE